MHETNTKLWAKFVLILSLALMCLLLICPPNKRPFLQEDLQHTQINFGLDLKGGSQLLYEINLQELDSQQTAQQVMDESIAVIHQRIFDSGIVKEPRINRQGKNQILVQLPGLNDSDTEKIKDAIEQLGNLRWCLVASPQIGTGKRSFDEAVEYNVYQKEKQRGERALSKYTKQLRSLGYKWFQDKGGGEHLLWIDAPYRITGKDLRHIKYDTLHKQIHFRLQTHAGKNFEKLTKKYQGQLLAIVFNNKIVSIAQIKDVISDSGFLTGFSAQQADLLVKTMRSGSLDIKPKLLYKNTIGPSIGEDSVNLGMYSTILSLSAVVVFIGVYYLFAGIVASLALLLNILLVFVVLILFKETLTLPGIAGLILTVGMSIDANIIIFERIREERLKRFTKTVDKHQLLDDIDSGFQKSFRSILDANITTFFTAAILYSIASGAIKGFAFTMLCGIVLSFFTAIFVTKTLLHVLIVSGISTKLHMMQIVNEPSFVFTNKMRKLGLISCFAVAASIICFATSNERIYGLDLRGGTLVQMSVKKPLETNDVRERLLKNFSDGIEVQRVINRQAKNREFSIRIAQENGIREKIQQLFSTELADKAFGKIEKIARGKLRNFIAVPLHLQTPVSVDFIEKTFAKSPFEKTLVALPKVIVNFQLKNAQHKSQLQKEIIQHLALARPEIEVQDINIEEKNPHFAAQISFTEPAPLETIHQAMTRCKFAQFDIQVASDFPGLVTDFVLLVDVPNTASRDWSQNEQYVEKTIRDIFQQTKFEEKQVHLSDPFPRFAKISGVVAKQQKTSAYRAILLSLIFILLYITVRFPNGWKYAIAAIFALAHDIAITVGIIALFSSMGWVNVEINLPVIAALLTIVGYSLNDTIIIFDRIRENREKQEDWQLLPGRKVEEIFNHSINQTLSRTLLTSLTTLFVAAILFFCNYNTGNILEGFAFTLIVGIIVGTYSSIFVASSLALRAELKART